MIKPIAQRSDLDFVDAPPPPPPPPPVQAYAPPPPANASLLSAEAHAAVGAAFGSLASSMMVGSNRTLEDVLKDMLRPMLKTWLDDNLPQLVERWSAPKSSGCRAVRVAEPGSGGPERGQPGAEP